MIALKDVFGESAFLPTKTIVGTLNEDEEAPWTAWKNGMTAEKLSAILKHFEVKSERPKKGQQRDVTGYSLEKLLPVFRRYLSSCPPTPENEAQPCPAPADQVAERVRGGQGYQNEPCPELALGNVENQTPPNASLTDSTNYKEWAELNSQNGGKEGKEEKTAKPWLLTDKQLHAVHMLYPYVDEGGLQLETWMDLSNIPELEFRGTVESLKQRGVVYEDAGCYLLGTPFTEANSPREISGLWLKSRRSRADQ